MAMTVSEAAAVFDLLHWLGWRPRWGDPRIVDDERAAQGLALLANHAGKTLQISVQPGEAADIVDTHAARLAAADSDGAAQAVCQGIGTHLAHGGSLPWPTIRRPYDEWVAAHDAANAPPPRVELDGQTSIEDHL